MNENLSKTIQTLPLTNVDDFFLCNIHQSESESKQTGDLLQKDVEYRMKVFKNRRKYRIEAKGFEENFYNRESKQNRIRYFVYGTNFRIIAFRSKDLSSHLGKKIFQIIFY